MWGRFFLAGFTIHLSWGSRMNSFTKDFIITKKKLCELEHTVPILLCWSLALAGMCKYLKLGSNKSLWRMKGPCLLWKRKVQEDFQTEGKDFDLWAAAQHHGSSSIIWSCSVTRARSLCVPSAMGDMELLTPQTQSALGALLLGRVWNVWIEHLRASSNRTEPNL